MVKRAPLTLQEKEYLYRRKQAGATHAQVAQELHCAPETVRKQWQAHRRGQAPRPRGRPRQGILSTFPPALRQRALALKRQNQLWGPLNVRVELGKEPDWAGQRLPSRSRLAALFKAECARAVRAYQKRPAPLPPLPKAEHIHQRWQIDAKEKIPLQDGRLASVLGIRDPVSAVILAGQAFDTTLADGKYRKLVWGEIQAVLRQTFTEWGRPAQLHTDHEDVYAGAPQSDFPMPITLWLVGLGIQHIFSRPRQPTDQPQIERNHRTLGDFGWKNRAPHNLADLQAQLDASRQRYNHDYPAQAADCQGQPPLVRHPQAHHSGRPYQVEREWDLFQLSAVDHYLAGLEWVRKVDLNGVVYLGNQRYQLGRSYRAHAVKIRFLPELRQFQFASEQDQRIGQLPAKGLEKSEITGLTSPEARSKSPFQLTLPWVGV